MENESNRGVPFYLLFKDFTSGVATFYTDTLPGDKEKNNEWGASIVKSKKAFTPAGSAK